MCTTPPMKLFGGTGVWLVFAEVRGERADCSTCFGPILFRPLDAKFRMLLRRRAEVNYRRPAVLGGGVVIGVEKPLVARARASMSDHA